MWSKREGNHSQRGPGVRLARQEVEVTPRLTHQPRSSDQGPSYHRRSGLVREAGRYGIGRYTSQTGGVGEGKEGRGTGPPSGSWLGGWRGGGAMNWDGQFWRVYRFWFGSAGNGSPGSSSGTRSARSTVGHPGDVCYSCLKDHPDSRREVWTGNVSSPTKRKNSNTSL